MAQGKRCAAIDVEECIGVSALFNTAPSWVGLRALTSFPTRSACLTMYLRRLVCLCQLPGTYDSALEKSVASACSIVTRVCCLSLFSAICKDSERQTNGWPVETLLRNVLQSSLRVHRSRGTRRSCILCVSDLTVLCVGPRNGVSGGAIHEARSTSLWGASQTGVC